jgi:hypothetical protein
MPLEFAHGTWFDFRQSGRVLDRLEHGRIRDADSSAACIAKVVAACLSGSTESPRRAAIAVKYFRIRLRQ